MEAEPAAFVATGSNLRSRVVYTGAPATRGLLRTRGREETGERQRGDFAGDLQPLRSRLPVMESTPYACIGDFGRELVRGVVVPRRCLQTLHGASELKVDPVCTEEGRKNAAFATRKPSIPARESGWFRRGRNRGPAG